MPNPDFEAVEEHFWMCLCNFVEHSRLGWTAGAFMYLSCFIFSSDVKHTSKDILYIPFQKVLFYSPYGISYRLSRDVIASYRSSFLFASLTYQAEWLEVFTRRCLLIQMLEYMPQTIWILVICGYVLVYSHKYYQIEWFYHQVQVVKQKEVL